MKKVTHEEALEYHSRRPAGKVWAVFENGPAAAKVDLLVLGDGYAEADLPKFHADARRLVAHVPLGRILAVTGEGAAYTGKERFRVGSRAAGIHDAFGYILRLEERSRREYSGAARLQRFEWNRLAEAVIVQLNAQFRAQIADFGRNFHSDRQDDQVELFVDHRRVTVPGRRSLSLRLDHVVRLIMHDHIMRERVFF